MTYMLILNCALKLVEEIILDKSLCKNFSLLCKLIFFFP